MKPRVYPKVYPASIVGDELNFIKTYLMNDKNLLKSAAVGAVSRIDHLSNSIRKCASDRGLPNTESLVECIFWIVNDLSAYPKTCSCGTTITNFHSFAWGYPHNRCSTKCSNNSLEVQAKKKAASIKKFGTEYPWQTKEIKDRMKQLHLEKYGVESNMQRDEIFKKNMKAQYRMKSFTMPSGKVVEVMGYEPQAISWLLSKGYQEEDLEVNNVPKIKYKLKDIRHLYIPDLFIRSENTLVEVKSSWTVSQDIVKNEAKAAASISAGYNHWLLVLDKEGNLIEEMLRDVKMRKFEDYLPNGYKPHLIRNIPSEVTVQRAIELGMDPTTPAPAVAKALTGSSWHCKSCGEQTQLISFNQGFREYCSTKCSNNAEAVIEEKHRVNLDRYGTIHPTKANSVRSKISKTKKSQRQPTRERIISFLQEENISFETSGTFISIKDGGVRIYPLDNIQELKWTDKKSYNFFQRTSIENEEAGIRTLWVKPWEFLPNGRQTEVLKSFILTACGRIKHVFNGRDCEVKELAKGELRPFLETNSFYGYRSATINLGLYLKKDVGDFKKGTLLMLYTFGHPFFAGKTKKFDLEVIRAATLLNCQVRGGASKLFTHFVKNFKTVTVGARKIEWETIVYYVDYDHNTGNSLPHLGFDFVSYSSPGFMNVDVATGIASHRKPMEHSKIKARMAAGEMFSVSNAGVKVFSFKKANAISPDSVFIGE